VVTLALERQAWWLWFFASCLCVDVNSFCSVFVVIFLVFRGGRAFVGFGIQGATAGGLLGDIVGSVPLVLVAVMVLVLRWEVAFVGFF